MHIVRYPTYLPYLRMPPLSTDFLRYVPTPLDDCVYPHFAFFFEVPLDWLTLLTNVSPYDHARIFVVRQSSG